MKRFFFKVCPKTGRIYGIRTDTFFHKIFFPIVGFLALCWVVFRVVPKPSRTEYPCQQVAIPVATIFLAWLMSITGSIILYQKSKLFFNHKKTAIAIAALIGSILLFLGAQFFDTNISFAQNKQDSEILKYTSDKPNQPIGIAKGIYPGRVTWARDIAATPWNGNGNWWRDTTGINQKVVEKMIAASLKAVSGATNDKQAWKKIFYYYNYTHGNGKTGYKNNEKIAIKINLNNCKKQDDADNKANASSQTILALIRQLVNNADVSPGNITVYDAIRAIPNRIYNPIHAEFPNVIFVDNVGKNGRLKTVWIKNAFSYSRDSVGNSGSVYGKNIQGNTDIPTCLKNAKYVINLPLLKGHEMAGITLAAKNHYGSIAARDHSSYLTVWRTKGQQYSSLVDLMGSKEIDGKTILFVLDGLFANITNVNDNNKENCAFNNLFRGQWCASIFMSLDEVALESVGLDFLSSEFGIKLGQSTINDKRTPILHCDNYLHEAALIGNPPSGTVYKPDGVKLTNSLGVHEHWNNSVEKKYSRNLGTGKGIELYVVK